MEGYREARERQRARVRAGSVSTASVWIDGPDGGRFMVAGELAALEYRADGLDMELRDEGGKYSVAVFLPERRALRRMLRRVFPFLPE